MKKETILIKTLLLVTSLIFAQNTFGETNGILVFEAEDMALSGSWKKQSSVTGYSGSGYINWTGADQFNDPGVGTITSKIKINTPGTYKFEWITKIGQGDSNTDFNDSWLKFTDADDFYAKDAVGNKPIVYPHGSSKTANPPSSSGRLAVVADGNYRDPDDIAGTPVSLAILRAFNKHKKLVHYSHSCDLVKASGDADPPNNLRHKEMQKSCDGTAEKWGGFEHIKFYNCQTEKNATINDLRDKINASSATDPLWIIEAGEPDIIWEAMNKAENAKRKFVYIITHHPNNDRGDDYNLESGGDKGNITDLGFPKANIRRIQDQNTLLKKPLSTWNWAKTHSDSRIKWLYERGFRAQESDQQYGGIVGDMDPSDAGMIYYWCTLDTPSGGDQKCDVPKLEKLFKDYVNNTLSTDDQIYDASSLVVFPNPSKNGIFNLKNAENFKVFSMMGQLIMEGNSESIDLSNKPKGIYFLKSNDKQSIKLLLE
jgi:hypothetical protein